MNNISHPGKLLNTDILDCTLRDGSYVIDFQFSAAQTSVLSRRLDALGFPLIEVGHGIGMGASERKMGVAAASDEAYMAATAEAIQRGKWGMFCIPGIAELRHLDMAADHDMDFVRVGCDVSDVGTTKPFIESALAKGMRVYANLMKSYAVPIEEFVAAAETCFEYGAYGVYIVDSAGGMLADEIADYADGVRQKRPEGRLGFHGHHNIGLGVSNAVACVENHFDVVDCSLQGFGRSAGNTPTEQLLATLIRSGYEVPYDPVEVMIAGEELIKPLIPCKGLDSIDLTSGLALFHSSHLRKVNTVAEQHDIDPRRLIIELCRHDKVAAPDHLLERCAETVAAIQN